MATYKIEPEPEPESSISFEEALAKLEAIVRDLEDGRLGLTESLARYEEGVKHLKLCYRSLQHAERRIELLTGVDAEGQPVTQLFDDEDLSVEEKARARSRRRSKSPGKSSPASGTNKASGSNASHVDQRDGSDEEEDGGIMDTGGRLF